MPPNPQNLKNFPPGKSGNPNGRPKGSYSIVSELKKIMNREIELTDPFTKKTTKGEIRKFLALRLATAALKGNLHAIRECLDRMDGKAFQEIEQHQIIDVTNINLKGLSDETLQTIISENNEDG